MAAVTVLVVTAMIGIGCGDDSGSSATGAKLTEPTKATLILDFLPNAVHAGIYRAVAAGYYEDENLDLEIIPPTSTSDPLKLIDSGKADIGIADAINTSSLIADGRPVKAIMALDQRPLAGIITRKEDGYKSPADLDGATLGITGDPSDEPISKWIVNEGGGDYDSLDVVTIGFNGVTNLESGKVNAFTGFWPADGVQVDVDGTPTTIFKLDDYNAPPYPGLVVFSTDERIKERSAVMQAFVTATTKGYEDTLADPEQSLKDLLAENPSLDEEVQKAQLDAYLPLFQASAPEYGVLQEDVVNDFGKWLVEIGLASEPITFDQFGTNKFVDGAKTG